MMPYIKGDKIELERVIKFDQHKSDIKWVREGEYYMPDHFDYDLNILRKSVTDTDSYAKYLEWLHDPEFVLDELWSDYIEGEKRQKYWLSSCTREGVWSSRKKKVTMNLEHYKLTPAPRKAP